jgi:hypothetical protein
MLRGSSPKAQDFHGLRSGAAPHERPLGHRLPEPGGLPNKACALLKHLLMIQECRQVSPGKQEANPVRHP